jgi:hypothetical protein
VWGQQWGRGGSVVWGQQWGGSVVWGQQWGGSVVVGRVCSVGPVIHGGEGL